MIIAGYPCIGKSTVAARNPKFIDLESSNFSQTGLIDWVSQYVKVAEDLNKTGHHVFVSTHPDVISLLQYDNDFMLIFPDLSLSAMWKDRAGRRYDQQSQNEIERDKNGRALARIVEHYEEDITSLMQYSCSRIILHDMVTKIDDIIK